MIYADHAATAPPERAAVDAMQAYLLSSFANPSQPYGFSQEARRALEQARRTVADCIGAKESEVFFTSGGTESDHWAIRGLADALAGNLYALTGETEHHAVHGAFTEWTKAGGRMRFLSPNADGRVTPEALETALNIDTPCGLVSLMLVNNELGVVQDVRALAECAHARGALFHTDAVQAVGRLPVDVRALDVDLLAASAHKFGGPKGVGFLYVRDGVQLSPFMRGGAQERGMRAGTENVAGAVGMAAALQARVQRMESDAAYLQKAESLLLADLRASGVDFLRNGLPPFVPGLLSLSFRGADGEVLLHRLDLQGICISTGAACDSVRTQISHVLRALRLPSVYALGTVRVSLGTENTEADVHAIADALVRTVRDTVRV